MSPHRAHVVHRLVRRDVRPKTELMICAVVGVAAAAVALVASTPPILAVLLGWDIASALYLMWVWSSTRRLDADQTRSRSTSFDPEDARQRDAILLVAAVVSLAAVGLVIARVGPSQGVARALQLGVGLGSVVLSWALVHIVYMLRYAHLYYQAGHRPIDFNGDDDPDYGDFAYLAFSIGMTYQVSDTSLQSRVMRRAALRHALLAYVFGTGILAATINLVASLSSG